MKRWMVIGCAFTLALGFAAGWTMRPAEVQPPVLSAVSSMETARDPLEQFRTERQQLRQRQIAQLDELIYGESADAETTESGKAAAAGADAMVGAGDDAGRAAAPA